MSSSADSALRAGSFPVPGNGLTARIDLAGGYRAVLALWTAWSAIWLAVIYLTAAGPQGPDDFMRLLEVRDLLAGQRWFDVTQYRMGPPGGASMHWSRLVDVPLAGAILLFSRILPMAQAEVAAMALVPLLYLLPALFALRSILLKLGFSGLGLLAGLALLPLFPLLPTNFAPMRIDHHAPQAVLLLVCAALLLRAPERLAAVAGGILAAACVAISLEALPLVAALAGIYGLAYALHGQRSLAWFLGSLAIAAPALSFATRPVSALTAGYCDVLLPGHMAAFAAAAVIAAALAFAPGQGALKGRLAALALLPLVCIPIAVATLGTCALNPMGELDPVVSRYWHAYVLEGLPIWHQLPSVAASLIWTLAILAVGAVLAYRKDLLAGEAGRAWLLLGLLALAANLYSLLVMRAALGAQLLTLPFAALLVTHFWPRARAIHAIAPRLLASVACLVLCTPVLASALLKPLDSSNDAVGIGAAGVGESCDLAALAALPPGTILASLDTAPEILARSPHSVVAGPYHRNQKDMLVVIETLTGDPAQAEATAKASEADYLAICIGSGETAILRRRRPDSLVNKLSEGESPDWLEPVGSFESGPLRAYRIVR